MSSATTTNNSNINNNAVTINSAFSNTESINSPRALPTMDELVIAANSSTTATPVAGVNKNSVNSFDNDGHVPSPRSKKPVWGWDYIMNFGLPADLEENVETAGQVSERNEHGSSSFMSILPTYPRSETPPQVVRRRSQQQLQERMEIFARLKSAGFFISQLLVPRERMIVVRLSLDEETLKEKAVHMGLELQLKKEYGSGYLDYSPQREYAFINEDMQQTWNCYFSPAQRALIILTVLQSKEHWGCDLSVEKLLCNQTVLQMFLLHSPPERDALVQNVVWKRLWDPTWKPSMDALREYFGAHVAFYFVFTSFYGRRLLAIALLSIPVYITINVLKPGAGTTKAKLILLWIFGVCLMIWCTYFLESWKRRSATICQRWGLSDYKADTIEQARAQFDGEMRLGFYCRGGFVPLEESCYADSAFSKGTKPPKKQEAPGQCVADAHIINMGESVTSPITPHEETCTDGEQNEEDVITPEKKQTRIIPNAYTYCDSRKEDLPQSPWKDTGSLRNARFQSWCVTVLFAMLMGGLTFLLLWYRLKIRKWAVGVIGESAGNLLPGILNSVLITIFEPIWKQISLQLTRHENRRTNQHYLDSLIYKRFALQFLSNYISLFYIAFVLPFISKDEKCTIGIDAVGATGVLSILQFDRTKADSKNPNCLAELEVQLGTLIIMRSTIGQINELLVPYLIIQVKRLWKFVCYFFVGVDDVHYDRNDTNLTNNNNANLTNSNNTNLINNNNTNLNSNTNNNNTGVDNDRPILRNVRSNSTGENGREMSIIERVMSESQRKNLVVSNVNNRYVQESNLMIYESTLDDYNEMVIQFGFICLFGVVFPPVCFVALINNLIEVRTDAYKILRLCQRPTVDNAADIGAWYNILEFLNILSVITNLAILIFTADSLHGLATGLREKTDPWQYVVIMVVFFVVAEHILLGIKFLLAFCIPDVPARINRRHAKQQFDIARHFNVGWREAFRGVSLLNVDPRQVALCTKEAANFDAVSEDGDIV